MNFSDKLRALRQESGYSQEQLAEKLHVSRQAITKWETEGGMPDIENLVAVAALFSVTVDDLIAQEKLTWIAPDYAYDSVTQYDITRPSTFDIHAPSAAEVRLKTTDDEKLVVRLASNTLPSLAQDFKVSLDEHRSRVDVNIRNNGAAGEAETKASLIILISLPAKYCAGVELSVLADALWLRGTECPFELDGKVGRITLESVGGEVSLNCNIDTAIEADSLPDVLEITQINATSRLRIPSEAKFFTKTHGKSTEIRFASGEAPTDVDAEHRIELAGMNAELTIVQGE